ncbi:MAG: AAA family ATPase [Clostridiaceae bacterium]|nr:AAA family ATPase [Clostridiaceae bacterium]
MNRVRLERSEKAITKFRENNKEFFGELMFLLHKYRDYYFNKKRFSLNYRCLFRIITDRTREGDTDNILYNQMKEDVEKIRNKYEYIFNDFSAIVKRHVDMDGNGYNMLVRLMYGESVDYILQETDMEETKRQRLRFDVITNLMDVFNEEKNGYFSDGIAKNIFITNFIIQSENYDYNTLSKLNAASHNQGKLSFVVSAIDSIKSTILEECDFTNADTMETSFETTGKPLIADSILNHPDYKSEVIHLEETVNAMMQEIDDLERKNSEIYEKLRKLLAINGKKNSMDLQIYSNIQKANSKKIMEIESVLDSPYFGRVDFKEDNSDEFESFYIGKVGFLQGLKYGVIDWRMPIASVFYECENGRATYEAPDGDGTFSGDVKLKRQYTIKDAQLISFTDDVIADKIASTLKRVDSKGQESIKDDVISDPVLVEKLKRNSDKRLKDIIETIRKEQNKIIRQPLNKVLVVQGVAGSGKSTVGLHRISYILYNNKKIDPRNILVVAPNKVFLDYIIDLLPNIDAKGVIQLTFEQLALDIIGTDLNILKDEKVEFFLSMPEGNLYQFLKDAIIGVSKFKGALSFITLVKYIIDKKTNEIISSLKDVSLFGGKFKISRYEQLRYLEGDIPLNNKIKNLKQAINYKVKEFIKQQELFRNIVELSKEENISFLNKYLKELKPVKPISVYKELFEDDHVHKTLYKNRYFSLVSQYTLKMLNSGCVEREDLAALCYIKYKIDGISSKHKYMHIFVDEAQDLSPLEFVILNLVSENNSMTIMGDINQGINFHRGIDSWEELINDIYSDLEPEYFEILNSYRSTKEIVEFSNKLVSKNLPKAKPVARDGEKPTIEKFSSIEDGIRKVIKMIKYYQENGCQTIGILAKKESECRDIYSALEELKDDFENINLIDETVDEYNGGISIVPIVMSKGLEFDAVILWNASDENFSDTDFDLKILYVAVTRPMHYLHILYKDNITVHLKDFTCRNIDSN